MKRLKARIISEGDEEQEKEVKQKVNRVFNSISQTILRSV